MATVTPKSPIKSGKDLLERIRKDPSSVSIAIPSLTGGGSLAILLAAKAAGIDPKKLKTVVFSNWRGIVGPRGLTPAQIAYWEGVFAKVVELDEFKRDLQRNNWVSNFLKSAEMRNFLRQQHDELRALLADLGMAKR